MSSFWIKASCPSVLQSPADLSTSITAQETVQGNLNFIKNINMHKFRFAHEFWRDWILWTAHMIIPAA